MRMRKYAKWIRVQIGCFIGIMSIVNIMFLVYNKETFVISDLVYMNGLCWLLFISGIGYYFIRISRVYREIEEKMKDSSELGEILNEEDEVLGASLARKVEAYKEDQFKQKESEYKEKMTNMMDYTTQMVHDIKVNLSVCEMISRRVNLEEREKLIYEIEQMRFRMNQVLYVARANHYSEDLKAEYFDVCNILKRAIKDNAEFFMNKGIEITVEVEPYEVLSDQKWVLYIMTQILNNSSKYTKPGGKVRVVSEEDERFYCIHIIDNGIGIAKEELARIFDKGFTGSNGRFNTKATGMGLYYAKQMANALNISLVAESVVGEYTKFTLIFYKHSDYMRLQEEEIQEQIKTEEMR